MVSDSRKKGLGRGLSALMQDIKKETVSSEVVKNTNFVPIENVYANTEQPRRSFDAQELDNLTMSILEKGIIQPIIVRPFPKKTDSYQIIAGERRWRAAQKANLHQVPVVVYELEDTEVLEYAIIENVQRSDLNAIEEATSYQDLIQKCGHTQEKLSSIVGKSRSYLSNMLRLLNLPDEVKSYLIDGQISIGHARALLSSQDPINLVHMVLKQNLNVRDTEKLVKNEGLQQLVKVPKAFSPQKKKDADTLVLEADLSAALNGMKVIFQNQSPNEGELKITYKSLDELDEVCRRLSSTF